MSSELRQATVRRPATPLRAEPHRPGSVYPIRVTRPAPGPADASGAQIVELLWRRKAALILGVVLGGLLGYALTYIQKPMYRAQTSIEIANLNQDFLNIKSVSPMSSSQPVDPTDYNVRTQTIVAKSTPVLERAVDKLNLVDRVIATVETRRPFLRGAPPRRPASDNTAARRNRAIGIVSAGLNVRVEPNTRLVNIIFESSDPQVAADVTNSVAEAFGESNLDRRIQDSRSTQEWLGRQLQELRAKLGKAEAAALNYARNASLPIISERSNVAEEGIRQIQVEMAKAQADRIVKQSRYEMAKIAPVESLPEVLDDPTLKDYQGQLTTLRRQLADLSNTFAAAHPKIVKAKAEIMTVESALERSRANILTRIRNDYDSAVRRESLLSSDYAAQMRAIGNQADSAAQYLLLRREADTARQLYDSLLQRVTEAGLASALRTSDMHVIQPAAPPAKPFKPNRLLNVAFGALSGMLIGFALIVARTGSQPAAPSQAIARLDVQELGVIPADSAQESSIRTLLERYGLAEPVPARRSLELTTWQRWSSAMAESFRWTVVSILRSDVNDGRNPAIAIASAVAGEGKTTVLSNLGIALAQIDCRVLLVDSNLRKPRLHEIFHVSNTLGFGDALAGHEFVSGSQTNIPGLSVMPAGSYCDERMMFSSRVNEVLDRLRDQYDIILIDTPPLLQSADARLIGIHSDAVILVVDQHTDPGAVQLAKQRLEGDGSRLLGAILNNCESVALSAGLADHATAARRA